jgi:hypothetical protein
MDIRVNQIGYLFGAPKRATLIGDSSAPVKWELLDDANQVVESGISKPVDNDYQIIDFSDFDEEGKFHLKVLPTVEEPQSGVSKPLISPTFEIGSNLYDGVLFDALDWFENNRPTGDLDLAQTLAATHLLDIVHRETRQGNDIGHGSVAALAKEEAKYLGAAPGIVTPELPTYDEAIAEITSQADRLVANPDAFGQFNITSDYGFTPSVLADLAEQAELIITADELTEELKYRNAALESIDYFFGRNPDGLIYDPNEFPVNVNAVIAKLLAYVSNEG